MIKLLKESYIIVFIYPLKKTNLLTLSNFISDKSIQRTHALIYLTELTRRQLGDGNYGSGIVDDFQQTFDIFDHDTFLKKYGIRGISNKWFASYLTKRNQFVSISGFNLIPAETICEVPQSSILGSSLFFVDIKDFPCAIKYLKYNSLLMTLI